MGRLWTQNPPPRAAAWGPSYISQKQKPRPQLEVLQESDSVFRPGIQPQLCVAPNLGQVL